MAKYTLQRGMAAAENELICRAGGGLALLQYEGQFLTFCDVAGRPVVTTGPDASNRRFAAIAATHGRIVIYRSPLRSGHMSTKAGGCPTAGFR